MIDDTRRHLQDALESLHVLRTYEMSSAAQVRVEGELNRIRDDVTAAISRFEALLPQLWGVA